MNLLHVLGILKIIGMVLLYLVSFILVILLLALFVPLHYKVYLNKDKDTYAYFGLNWLISLIRLKVIYKEKNVTFKFSILGLPLGKIFSRRKKKTKLKKKSAKEKKQNNLSSNIEDTKKVILDKKNKNKKSKKNNKKEKLSWAEKKDRFIIKIRKVKKSVLNAFEKISDVKEFIDKSSNKVGIESIKKYALLLLKHIKPRKIRGRVRFGFDKPDVTGEVLALISMVYTWYGSNVDCDVQKHVQILPDFYEKVFEINFFIKGKIRIVVVLTILIRVLKDRSIKILKNNFSKSFK